MTRPTKGQRQRQKQIQWQIQIHLENSAILETFDLKLKVQDSTMLNCNECKWSGKTQFWRGISELPIQRTSSPDPKQLLWFYDFSCDELISNDWLQEQIKRSIKTCLAELRMSLMRNNILDKSLRNRMILLGKTWDLNLKILFIYQVQAENLTGYLKWASFKLHSSDIISLRVQLFEKFWNGRF